MKTTTISILISVLCFLSLACKTEALQPTDPLDLLPPATQTGENTLGFLLDGEPWMPNRIFQGDYRKSDGRFGISCQNDTYNNQGEKTGQDFGLGSINVPIYTTGTYTTGNQGDISIRLFDYKKTCVYWSNEALPGTLNVEVLDTVNRIISGTFETKILSPSCGDTLELTEGRFDVSF